MSSFCSTIRGLSPAWRARIPATAISRSATSVVVRPLRATLMGMNRMLARPTAISVAMNATWMPAPSFSGSERWAMTAIRPMTAPRMPNVGA